jgi:hypothetical protein
MGGRTVPVVLEHSICFFCTLLLAAADTMRRPVHNTLVAVVVGNNRHHVRGKILVVRIVRWPVWWLQQ